jgi:uncharacterized protein
MSRPGTTITRSETRPGRSAPTGTGPWFVVGPTGTADADAAGPRKPIKSLSEYATRFGARAAHVNDGGGGAGLLYDAVDAYFRGGGSECYVSPATYNATVGTYETNIVTALGLFTKDLGPGQVSVPGRTTPATKLALAVHAEANNRVAILATSNTAVVATLTGEATIASITPGQERVTSLWTPWVTFNSGGVTRTISPEAIVAALMAENDGLGVTPNQPSAGTFGVSSVAESVASAFNDADRATLNTNGVNLLRLMFDGVRVYGYRTLADPTSDSNWVSLANARLFMSIQAQADAVAERFVFRQLDGQRKTINEFGGALTGVLLPFWANGSLYGVTPEEAFRVDVGEAVNTDTTIANKELHAILQLRTSEFAEEVILELVKTRITEGIS